MERLLEKALESDGAGNPDDARALVQASEQALALEAGRSVCRELWCQYLNLTRRSNFLIALGDVSWRERWAEVAFAVIRTINFTLGDLLDQRAHEHPDRTLLATGFGGSYERWSYEQVASRTAACAAALWAAAGDDQPRVAIVSENSVPSALADLTCLCHSVLVTPLSPHSDRETMAWIFARLEINVVLVGSNELRARVERALSDRGRQAVVIDLMPGGTDATETLHERAARLDVHEARDRLRRRSRPGPDEVATVMFTSGSTGQPKGVVFSQWNLVSKRFARAAALPGVGDGEVLLGFLPLYHTFGRYLEMLGMLFWGGTYVLAEDPSAATFFARLPEVRPTGLISVPARWQQLADRCGERIGELVDPELQPRAVRQVVGDRLRWGLSAAGYLEPSVFHFFQHFGVDLMSGFGMTEATGGITMTPPGAYEDGVVGQPLPGIRTRFTSSSELEISGPYVASYLNEDGGASDGESGWLATGDVFQIRPSGNYEIVDRVKDIYKNSKGRTIAPRKIEQQFEGVPGIRRTFLVGDGRADNVLLVVPDWDDPVYQEAADHHAFEGYLRRIVSAANEYLASYERVVDLAVLERDFSLELGELTPKGSFRRQQIEKSFADAIAALYSRAGVELELAGITIRLPRWLLRDLGVLESDLAVVDNAVVNRPQERSLTVCPGRDGRIQIGSLEYTVAGTVVDLGVLARQPRLWVANPELVRFVPCRATWEVDLGGIEPQVFRPAQLTGEELEPVELPHLVLGAVHGLCCRALFGRGEPAVTAVRALAVRCEQADRHMIRVIRRRLEALADHPDFEVRALAYRTLLLEQPHPSYDKLLPTFLLSGERFLDAASIELLAGDLIEPQHLRALRRRMHSYRTTLAWPVTGPVRMSLLDILKMLVDHAGRHPQAYPSVRAELACWIVHAPDPVIAEHAEQWLLELANVVIDRLSPAQRSWSPEDWQERVFLEPEIGLGERERLINLLTRTPFLAESVCFLSDNECLDPSTVAPRGVWVSPFPELSGHQAYRVSVNTVSGRHYDVLIELRSDLDSREVSDTVLWMAAVQGHPWGPPAMPALGCCQPGLEALSVEFIPELRARHRIRELATQGLGSDVAADTHRWRTLYVRSMAAYFRVWRATDREIVPGLLTPGNVCVPEPDVREGEKVLSLAGWRPYRGPLSIVRPLLRNFYERTRHLYPRAARGLDTTWLLEGCCEGLGEQDALVFLEELEQQLSSPVTGPERELIAVLKPFCDRLRRSGRRPLVVDCATERYRQWLRVNGEATRAAREQAVAGLITAYRLQRYPERFRYRLYRDTYFADASADVVAAFDALLEQMRRAPAMPATMTAELCELSAAITDGEDRAVLQRLVFPAVSRDHPLDIASLAGSGRRGVVVESTIADLEGIDYTVRDGVEPYEIGQLYRLFVRAGFPIALGDAHRTVVVVDGSGRIVGGAVWHSDEESVAALEGVVTALALRGRGLNRAILVDLCLRLSAAGFTTVTAPLPLARFYGRNGFSPDPRWGGLVRFLSDTGEVANSPP